MDYMNVRIPIPKGKYHIFCLMSFLTMVLVGRELFSQHNVTWMPYDADFQSPDIAVADMPSWNLSGTTQMMTQRKELVPKYVHLIWFYPEGTNFRFHHLMCLMSIQIHIKPKRIIFWYSHEPRGPWWAFAKKTVSDIGLVHYEVPTQVFNQSVDIVEHQSDIARLDILIKYGGIYLDLDVVALRDLGPLLNHPVTLGAETPQLLGSGMILAEPNASFLHLWKEAYRNYDSAKWNYNSVIVPMQIAKDNSHLVHIDWFSIQRPNWFEREWLYTDRKLWDWSQNYAVHLWYRTHNIDYDPNSIRTLNTTVGEIFRYIYYGNPTLLKSF